jgi:ribonuclease-3
MRKFFSRLFSRPKKNDRIAAYIQRSFGYTPTDTRLYEQALRHSSAIYRGAEGYDRSNERLEFLGDAVIDIIVAEYLYIKHEQLSEGELTKMKAKVVSRRMLNQIGSKLGIAEQLETKLGKQPIHRSMIGNAFEALIGALYLDKGYEFTRKTLLKILQDNKVDERVHDVTDFKSKLHEWCQKKRKTLDFEVVKENLKGPEHERYEIVAIVDGERLGRGKGKSKKTAEQIAAKEVCNQLFGEND